MTKIAEGRMIVKRIKIRIPTMKGEAIIRKPDDPETPPPAAEQEEKPQ